MGNIVLEEFQEQKEASKGTNKPKGNNEKLKEGSKGTNKPKRKLEQGLLWLQLEL